MKYHLVVVAASCTYYTTRRGIKLKELDGSNVQPTPSGQECFVQDSQVLEDFALDCIVAAETTPNVLWFAECSVSRKGFEGPWGGEDKSPARWDKFKEWGTFWDTPTI